MNKNITISDVAEALGVSKTTVSRAISGKGRIGEATRLRVLEYIEQCDYKPNVIAKSLAQSKTFNICVVMPGDFALMDLPFFQSVILGIQEIAGINEYDILLCVCSDSDISGLERIISNGKVDGYTGNLDVDYWYKDMSDKTTGLRMKSNTANSITLSWDDTSDVQKYRVYRYDRESGSYKYIKSSYSRVKTPLFYQFYHTFYHYLNM